MGTMKNILRSKATLYVVLAAIIVALVYYFWGKNVSTTQKPAGGRNSNQASVSYITVTQGDIPVETNAIGTVTASKTVTILPKVDGQLLDIRFREGQIVKAGQVLAVIDSRDLTSAVQQAKGSLQTSQASLENARADLQRYVTLVAQDSIAQQKLDTQRSLVKQLEGSVRNSQATLSNAQLQMSYAQVTAPISGRIGLKTVDVGTQVKNGTTAIAVITQSDPMLVTFSLADHFLSDISKAREQGRDLVVQAWDRDNTKQLSSGSISAFDNQIDSATGTFKVKAEFKGAGNDLFPNQFVNARVQLQTIVNGILIPQAAVQIGPNNRYVWVVDADNKVHNRPVTLGPEQGDSYVISEGLQAGEHVVVDGVDRLAEGMAVKAYDKAAVNAAPTAPVTPTDAAGAAPATAADATAPTTSSDGGTERKHHRRSEDAQGTAAAPTNSATPAPAAP